MTTRSSTAISRFPLTPFGFFGCAVFACTAVPLLAAPLSAQEPDPFGPLAVFQMADRQEWVMRASLSNGAILVGRVRNVDAVSAQLDEGRVRFADLVLLERGERDPGGLLRGAVIGGAVLGGLAALVLYVAPIGDEDRDEDDVLLGISAAAAAGALAGGLLGAWLSPPGMDWSPIWPGSAVDR